MSKASKTICPHCGEVAMSSLKKSCLGPVYKVECKACGGKVGVSYWSSISLFVPIIGALIAMDFMTPYLKISLLPAIMITMLIVVTVVWVFYIPLIKK